MKQGIDFTGLEKLLKGPARAERIGPDSLYIPHLVQQLEEFDADALFTDIDTNARWTETTDKFMLYRKRMLKRQKAFHCKAPPEHIKGESLAIAFKYFYPGFQYAAIEHYGVFDDMPEVARLVKELERVCACNGVPITLTQLIATRYRDGEDGIGFHKDKVKDIRPGSPILVFSFGESREMHLGVRETRKGKERFRLKRALVLNHGDLFILGPETNKCSWHAIVPVKDERVIQRPEGYQVKPRISLVIRNIKTTVTKEQYEAKARKAALEAEKRDLKRRRAARERRTEETLMSLI